MDRRHLTPVLLLVAACATGAPPPPARAEDGATVAALERAQEREVEAQWHYLAWAEGARRAGQPQVARLFRAVAQGEAVHAANLRRELERLGGVARTRIGSVVVRTPAENLAAAIEREHFERTEAYRHWSDLARAEFLPDALAAFGYARAAEATHERLFAAALARLQAEPRERLLASATALPVEAFVTDARTPLFVCGDCGSVFDARPARACPNCGSGGHRFRTVF